MGLATTGYSHIWTHGQKTTFLSTNENIKDEVLHVRKGCKKIKQRKTLNAAVPASCFLPVIISQIIIEC